MNTSVLWVAPDKKHKRLLLGDVKFAIKSQRTIKNTHDKLLSSHKNVLYIALLNFVKIFIYKILNNIIYCT